MTWTSVTDRLPDDYQEVLYFATMNKSKSKEIMTGHLENGHWTHCCLFYSTMILNDECIVTHWMELPKYPTHTPDNVAQSHAQKFSENFMDEHGDVMKRLADR